MPTEHRRTRKRYEQPYDLRFLTFSCHDRLPLLSNPQIADLFVEQLASTRARLRFALLAWVVMPEHVHLLIWPRLPEVPVPTVLRSLKQPFAQRVVTRWKELDAKILRRLTNSAGQVRFWLRGGGYDRNTFSEQELSEKIRYIHFNPVARGLVEKTTDWRWSSARWYAGIREGEVAIDPLKRPE